jgi:uncharacterized protein (DUF2062 family)
MTAAKAQVSEVSGPMTEGIVIGRVIAGVMAVRASVARVIGGLVPRSRRRRVRHRCGYRGRRAWGDEHTRGGPP